MNGETETVSVLTISNTGCPLSVKAGEGKEGT